VIAGVGAINLEERDKVTGAPDEIYGECLLPDDEEQAMLIHPPTISTVTKAGTTRKWVRCEHCDADFVYLMKREVVGTGISVRFMDYQGAAERAQESADAQLQQALEGHFELVPCPACGSYQSYMVERIRLKKRSNALFTTGILLMIVSAISGLSLARNLFDGTLDADSVLVKVAAVASIIAFLGGLTLLWLWISRSNNYDPNRLEGAEERISFGKRMACLKKDYERMLAASVESPREAPQTPSVRCEHCSSEIVFLRNRDGAGPGNDAVLTRADEVVELARLATEGGSQRLADDALIPCPSCGNYQPNMIPQLQKRDCPPGLFNLAVLLSIISPPALLAGAAGLANSGLDPSSLQIMIIVLGIGISAGLAAIVLFAAHFRGQKNYDPNSPEGVEERIALGRKSACLKHEYEETLAEWEREEEIAELEFNQARQLSRENRSLDALEKMHGILNAYPETGAARKVRELLGHKTGNVRGSSPDFF
jgi:hypothetical protein